MKRLSTLLKNNTNVVGYIARNGIFLIERTNKGKKYYRNPETNEGNYFIEGAQPSNWIRGHGKRK